jgi:SAM-dependent methyltransferase
MIPSYGRSGHYVGDKGERYFAWQNANAEVGGKLNARTFAHFCEGQGTILDFGCGGGFTLKNISCQRRIGVEINPAARQIAIDNGIECHSDLTEVSSALVDVVISNHALEHVPSPIEALRQLYRTLKAPGTLVVVLPIDDWRTERRFDPSDINHHLYTWTPLLIGNCLVEAGFPPTNLQINIFTHAWFPGYSRAYNLLPAPIFEIACRFYSVLRRRRQIIAVATKIT